MENGSTPRGQATIRRWFGWTRDVATVAVGLDDDVATILCLRRRSVITASGRAVLAPGTVRDGHLRLVDPAIETLSRLRTDLQLPDAARVVVLVKPRSVEVAGPTVIAAVEADEIAARNQVIQAAGFAAPTFDPVPAALARLGLARLGLATDGPVYAEGAGWRSYRDRGHLEIEPSDRTIAEVVVGPSPVERAPLATPDPIVVDRGVALLRGWPILLGAALGTAGIAPTARIDEIAPTQAAGWAVERVTDGGGDLR